MQKGHPIPDEIMAKMEKVFGTDFSDVRLHPNSPAQVVQSARAFTHSNDIYFAPGQYSPLSQAGQQLLGHELTHLLQQRQGRVPPNGGANSDRILTAERRLSGYAASAGTPAPIHGTGK